MIKKKENIQQVQGKFIKLTIKRRKIGEEGKKGQKKYEKEEINKNFINKLLANIWYKKKTTITFHL